MWFDPAPIEALQDAVPEWMALVFAAGSHLGSIWFVAPLVVLAYLFRDRHRFAVWIPTVMGGYAIMVGLKGYFSTPRPDVGPEIAPEALPTVLAAVYAPAVEFSSASFPSGHAIAAVVIWTAIALETDWGTRRQRLLGAAATVVVVSVSRVGAGVHYPIDVAVGTGIGVGYVGSVLALRRWARSRRGIDETAAVFAASATLAALAFVIGGRPDAVALLGGSIGGLLAWTYATPPREPWPVTGTVLVWGGLGVGLLVPIATILTTTTAPGVWFVVGGVGSVVVFAMPRLVPRTTRRPLHTTTPTDD